MRFLVEEKFAGQAPLKERDVSVAGGVIVGHCGSLGQAVQFPEQFHGDHFEVQQACIVDSLMR